MQPLIPLLGRCAEPKICCPAGSFSTLYRAALVCNINRWREFFTEGPGGDDKRIAVVMPFSELLDSPRFPPIFFFSYFGTFTHLGGFSFPPMFWIM